MAQASEQINETSPFYRSKFFWACAGLILLALILRVILTPIFEGHPTDIRNFKIWGMHLARNGFRGLYESAGSSGGIWCDYPPLYMLPLWFFSRIYMLFDPNFAHWNKDGFTLLAKMPSILTDLGCIAFIILILKRYIHLYLAFFAGLIFALHPAVLYESAIWGQVDSVTLLLQLIGIWYLIQKRYDLAIFVTALNILVKPQGLILLPFILFLAVYKQEWKQFVLGTIYSFGFAFLLSWLFVPLTFVSVQGIPLPHNMVWLWGQYTSQADLYSYSSIQAFNFWSLMGDWQSALMWKKDFRGIFNLGGNHPAKYLQHKTWGLILFSFFYALSLFYYWFKAKKLKQDEDEGVLIWHTSTLIMIAFFLFPTRMHERYLYSGLMLLLGSALLNKKLYWAFWAYSITFTVNLFYELPGYTGYKKDLDFPGAFYWINDFLSGQLALGKIPAFPYYKIFSVANCLLFFYLLFVLFKDPLVQTSHTLLEKLKEKLKVLQTVNPNWIPAPKALDLKDAYIIGGFLLSSALLKLWRIGFPPELVFDEVYHARTAGEYVTGVLTHADRTYEWVHPPLAKLLISLGVYAYDLTGVGWRVMPVIAGTLLLMVIYILGRQTMPHRWQAVMATLFLACDGVYFVQSRIAMTNIFATLFQVSALAFTWRFLQFHWHRPKDKRNLVYFFLTLIMMGLALSTRWTSLWAYGFVILTFGFLVMIPSLVNFEGFYKRLYLFLSETTESILEKSFLYQNIVYTSFFMIFVSIIFGLSQWKQHHSLTYLGMASILGIFVFCAPIIKETWPFFARHFEWAPKERRINIFFFGAIPVLTLVIPLCIYILTYIPIYIDFSSWDAFRTSFVFTSKMQVAIWNYHSSLKDPHPYYSTWYSWPLLYRPTWYYFESMGKQMAGIFALGNPAIWWVSMPVVILVLLRGFFTKALNVWYISVACLFMYLPWGLSPRTLNYTHYFFEALPYACLCIAFYMKDLAKVFEFIFAPIIYVGLLISSQLGFFKVKLEYQAAVRLSWTAGFYFYPALVVGLFILFFPIYSALPISWEYFKLLRWFPKWI